MSWENDTHIGDDAFDSKNREIPAHREHRAEDQPRQDSYGSNRPQGINNGGGYGNNNRPQGGGYGNNRPQGGGGGGSGRGGYGGGGGRSQGGGNGGNGFQRKVLTPEELADYKLYKSVVFCGEDKCPDTVIATVVELIREFEDRDFVVRHSCLRGFEEEICNKVKNGEFFLPWKDFGGHNSKLTYTPEEAKEIAKRCYPGFENLRLPMQGFSATRVRMMMGKNMNSPTQMLIVWTDDGAESVTERTASSGFTGIAIDIANQLSIPVFNLQRPNAVERIRAHLSKR